MFDELVWQPDRMILGDLVFRLEHYRDERCEHGEECFSFYKIKPLVDQYARFWRSRPSFQPGNVLELGIWDGGSVAFWFECFQPRKYVAIDISSRSDSEYFQRYVRTRGLGDRVRTYWGVDQADSRRLRTIADDEFSGPLDLVIDDASHMYEATKASFEALFPLLRPGGLYVIEDWAWAHWKEFQAVDHPWSMCTEPTKLIFEPVEATGSSSDLIASLVIFQGFTAVERGHPGLDRLDGFELEKVIARRPRPSILRRAFRAMRG